jgi:hypothetical protein
LGRIQGSIVHLVFPKAPILPIVWTAPVFAGKKEPLGYVSDHIGLRARLSLAHQGDGAASLT